MNNSTVENNQPDLQQTDVMCRYPLATKSGIELMFAMLLHSGTMCPKCGYGTRNTSKKWAKCKRCGERVSRAVMAS